MATRSPSVERVCAAAVTHFAKRGYDGSSLKEIAEAVGIRKASLYAHFASKDALFLEVLSDALQIELEFAQKCFAAESTNAQPGSLYCAALAQRYSDSEHLRFLLRTGYVPPDALQEQIYAAYVRYLAQLLDGFTTRLCHWPETSDQLAKEDVKLYGQAYLAIVDSLHVKLVYTDGKQLDVRLKAMQRLLEDSLRLATRQ